MCQNEKTEALLKSVLYPKRFDLHCLPRPIKWGIENECRAREEYTLYMRANGHNVETRPSGFIIHPTICWLSASPDAFVTDSSELLQNGIAEFKCPYSKRDVSPIDACKDPSFYCSWTDNKMHLKRDHTYYHQVQLQLFVSMDMCHWCDFCIYTLKGVATERIWLDTDWCNLHISELKSYYDAYMIPEIISGNLKPSYVY